ncbi:MAG: hypothetical protein ACJ759_14565 [Thermoanaerobaculia bacterium]
MADKKPDLPTPLARRYVRYVVGFGVAVGIGLAPFLGKVPGLDVLARLFPSDLRSILIPFSAFLMGLIAVAIQFYSGESIDRPILRRRFTRSLVVLLIGLLLLITLHNLLVVQFPINGGRSSIPVIVAQSRTKDCGCKSSDDIECLVEISISPRAVERCWGSRPLKMSRLVLSLSYLLVTGGFGALIGLLLLQEESRRREAAEAKRSRRQIKTASNL